MRIGYLILAHQHPHLLARLIRLIDEAGGVIAVHYDRNAGDAPVDQLKKLLGPLADKVAWAQRTSVAWGAWSIAEATLNGLEALARCGRPVDYVHLMSGADYPIRALSDFAAHLEKTRGTEYIEAVDIRQRKWVRIGPEHERYLYRHHFNWRQHPWLSQRYWRLQRRLRLTRRFPRGLSPHLGSQWWTLTWPTCQRIMEAGRDPALRRFFRTVAIPDEMFFQTVVAGHVPRHRIAPAGLTFSQFTDYGVPVVYYDDHASYLARQPFFFARKISPNATGLRDNLDGIVRGAHTLPAMSPAHVAVRSNEYEAVRVMRREPPAGLRIIGRVPDPEFGDLATARPFLAVFGASRHELALVQQLIAASGAVVCHGALFAPEAIAFVGGLERYAGYRRDDLRLRDHSPTTFLGDVLRKSGRIPSGFVLPWGGDGGLTGLLKRLPAAQPLIVRGNVLRAFLEHRTIATPASETICEGEVAGFLHRLDGYHKGLVQELTSEVGTEAAEAHTISLMSPDWIDTLNDTLAALGDACGSDTVGRVTPDLAAAAASRLRDPAELILNAGDLIRDLLPPLDRRAHLAALPAIDTARATAPAIERIRPAETIPPTPRRIATAAE